MPRGRAAAILPGVVMGMLAALLGWVVWAGLG